MKKNELKRMRVLMLLMFIFGVAFGYALKKQAIQVNIPELKIPAIQSDVKVDDIECYDMVNDPLEKKLIDCTGEYLPVNYDDGPCPYEEIWCSGDICERSAQLWEYNK